MNEYGRFHIFFLLIFHKILQDKEFDIKKVCTEEGEVELPWGLAGAMNYVILSDIKKIITVYKLFNSLL